MSLHTVGWDGSEWVCSECGESRLVTEKRLVEHYREEHPEELP